MKTKNELLNSIVSEIEELNSKVEELNSFIHSDDFSKLDELDCDLLYLYRHSMLMYLHVLILRKERLSDE